MRETKIALIELRSGHFVVLDLARQLLTEAQI